MNHSFHPEKRTLIIYILLILLNLLGIGLAYWDEYYFGDVFAREDGWIENSTAIVLMGVGIFCVYRLIVWWRTCGFWSKLFYSFTALLFLFAAGEEISWGQRLLDIESSEFFTEKNKQGEMNIHNLEVEGVSLNKLIFSQLLGVAVILYFLILPWLYQKSEWVMKVIREVGIPVPALHHTIVFIAIVLLVLLIPSDKKWELLELDFSVIMLMIFLANEQSERKKKRFHFK